MTAKSKWCGHVIEWTGDQWVYASDKKAVVENPRPCTRCGHWEDMTVTLLRNQPICPLCKHPMVPTTHEVEPGDWIFYWKCGCHPDPEAIEASYKIAGKTQEEK